MSGDVVLAYFLGFLVAGAWYLSMNRKPRNPWAELVITTAIWTVTGFAFFVAILVVAR